MGALDDFIAKRENWQRASEAAKVASRELRAQRETERSEALVTDDDDTDEKSDDGDEG